MKKLNILLLLFILFSFSCKKEPAVEKDTTYTFLDSSVYEESVLEAEYIFYEYDKYGNFTTRSFLTYKKIPEFSDRSRTFTVNPNITHIKIFRKLSSFTISLPGGKEAWISEIFYLTKGSHKNITVNRNTMTQSTEPF
ncbi:MAG: hypothetical protein LBH22_01755 [Bacteroidales bacterium]|jgi:hypothetical protein|nr:hypothetical protein [Bacteroidales bacterium]